MTQILNFNVKKPFTMMKESDCEVVTSNTSTCLCCFTNGKSLVPLLTCKHTVFLKNYFKDKLNFQNKTICMTCHDILKKIQWFLNQIELSNFLLDGKEYQSKKRISCQGSNFEVLTLKNNIFKIKIKPSDLNSKPITKEPLLVNLKPVKMEPKIVDLQALKKEVDTTKPLKKVTIVVNAKPVKMEPNVSLKPSYDDQSETIHENYTDSQLLNMDLEDSFINSESVYEKETEIFENKDEVISDAYSEVEEIIIEQEDLDNIVKNTRIKIIELNDDELEAERERALIDDSYTKTGFKCETCIISYGHAIYLERHMATSHNKNNPHECEICKCTFDAEYKVEPHVRRHFLRYHCLDCDKIYTDKQTAVSHWQAMHADDPEVYRCQQPNCDYETISRANFKYHKLTHNKVECPICKKLYLKGSQLRLHINSVHENASKFSCDLCDKSYKHRSTLESHMSLTHADTTHAYYCDHCRRFFRTANTLAHHLNVHSEHAENKYICAECSKAFTNKGSLRDHIESTHLNLKPFKCFLCDKKYSKAVILRRHMRFVHENRKMPRDKICEQCGRVFTTHQFRVHMRTHTGERPFVCHRCGATFAHSSALYNHNRVHSTNKRRKNEE